MPTIYRMQNRKITYIILFLIVCLGRNASAQQDPMFTQYMHNPVTINPAYAGSRGALNFVAMHRQQWVGIEGAPKTLVFSVNSPFINYNVGLGLSIIQDEIGPLKITGISTAYSYNLRISPKLKLAFGLNGGANMYVFDIMGSRGSEKETDMLADAYFKKVLPNFGVGSFLYSDRFYAGLSIPKMIKNSISDDPNNNQILNKEERHFFFIGGVVLDVSENIKFKPSTTVRIVVGSPVSAELSAAFLLHNKLWLGSMFRYGDSVGALAKFDLTDDLSVGYSFDYTMSDLRKYNNNGTHEVFFSFDIAIHNKKTLSPRYF